MKYDDLVKLLGKQGFFDLASVVQLTGERRGTIHVQLHRWCKAGGLLALRRGMYAFADSYSGVAVNPAELANRLYSPSYISTYWALGFYGLIPEKVVTYTSVTTRVTRSFSNVCGTFRYRSLKPAAFFGYKPASIAGKKVLMAEPEKALLDLWYLEKGRWDEERMDGMRFQNTELVDGPKMREYAERYGAPRVAKSAAMFLALSRSEEKGAIEL